MKYRNERGRPIGHSAALLNEEAERERKRHRIGLAAAVGAVAIGGILLGVAVSGGRGGIDTGSLIAWADVRGDAARAAPDEDASAAAASSVPVASGENRTPAAKPAKTASIAKPAGPAAQKSSRGIAAAKQDALSPDDRIARAMKSAAAARPSQKKVEKLVTAANERQNQSRFGDGLTDTVPGSSAYAPTNSAASTEEDANGALGAIENVDKTGSLATEKQEPQADEGDSDSGTVAAFPSGPMRSAAAKDAVHMRAGPSNTARIITTIPDNASIKATQDCPKSWCGVVYNGRRGFVYKGYVGGGAAAKASTSNSDTLAEVAQDGDTKEQREKAFNSVARSLLEKQRQAAQARR